MADGKKSNAEKLKAARARLADIREQVTDYVQSEKAKQDMDEVVTVGGGAFGGYWDAMGYDLEAGKNPDGSPMMIPGSLVYGVGVNIAGRILGDRAPALSRGIRKFGVGAAAYGAGRLVNERATK